MSCGVGQRLGSDPAFLWLWCRLAATDPIRPLAWEPPHAAGAAQRNGKNKKDKKLKIKNNLKNKKEQMSWSAEPLTPVLHGAEIMKLQ